MSHDERSQSAACRQWQPALVSWSESRHLSRWARHRARTPGDCGEADRILLTLATGKTFIAFQIAWKLFQPPASMS